MLCCQAQLSLFPLVTVVTGTDRHCSFIQGGPRGKQSNFLIGLFFEISIRNGVSFCQLYEAPNVLHFSSRVIHFALEKDIIFNAEGILKAARKSLELENDLISVEQKL